MHNLTNKEGLETLSQDKKTYACAQFFPPPIVVVARPTHCLKVLQIFLLLGHFPSSFFRCTGKLQFTFSFSPCYSFFSSVLYRPSNRSRVLCRQECTKKREWKMNAFFRKAKEFPDFLKWKLWKENCILIRLVLAFYVHRDIKQDVEWGDGRVMHFIHKDTRIECEEKISLRFTSLKLSMLFWR